MPSVLLSVSFPAPVAGRSGVGVIEGLPGSSEILAFTGPMATEAFIYIVAGSFMIHSSTITFSQPLVTITSSSPECCGFECVSSPNPFLSCSACVDSPYEQTSRKEVRSIM